MLAAFRALFLSVATASTAANDVATAASYHSTAYRKTSLISAALKLKEATADSKVTDEDITALLS